MIYPDIFILDNLIVSNVFLIRTGESYTMIDCGVPPDAKKIIETLRTHNIDLPNIKTIVLTHSHFDHIGGVAKVVAATGASVLAHADDIPYIQGEKPLPSRSFGQKMINLLMAKMQSLTQNFKVDRAVKDGDLVDESAQMTVVHTPGHTPGSISIHLKRSGKEILFCGDAIFNAHPITRRSGLQLPMKIVSVDMKAVADSVEKIRAMKIDVLCCGHGAPIFDGTQEKLVNLRKA
jgi:glyoxylase-like metal-dependent hydrolase (beta-lactamase superfamily II)